MRKYKFFNQNKNTKLCNCIFIAYSLDSIAKCAYGIETNTYKGEDNIYFRVAEAFFADIRVGDGVTSLFINLMYHFPYIAKLFGFFSAEALKVVDITKQIIKDRDAKNIHLGDFVDRYVFVYVFTFQMFVQTASFSVRCDFFCKFENCRQL